MAASLHVEMVTPEKVRFTGDAVSLTLPGSEGQMGILAHHEPIVALLDPGVMRVHTSDGEQVFASGEGFVQMRGNKATVIVGFAETADEISLEACRKDLAESAKVAREATGPGERQRGLTACKAAQARVQVASTKR